jgi:hypothetical protein
MLCAVTFFIGMFPDFGIAYLREVAKRYLGQSVIAPEEASLLLVSGIDLWHESRFRQDAINNAHNLAHTDLPRLVQTFPFPIGQLVAWVDEALLIATASDEQVERLSRCGLRRASALVLAAADASLRSQLAEVSGLREDALDVLSLALAQSVNLPRVLRFQGAELQREGRAAVPRPAARAVAALTAGGSEPQVRACA